MSRRSPRILRRRGRPPISLIRPEADLVVRVHDGRRLGVAEFGIRSALPVLYFHGFIGSRLEPGAAELYDTNIIAFDRPGYGRTDLQRLPSLRTWGADVAEALVQLGVGQCMVVGVSTGAPYALAVDTPTTMHWPTPSCTRASATSAPQVRSEGRRCRSVRP